MSELTRPERLQIMLTNEELEALDDWRFQRRMPSRAAAVRELLKRGLKAEGIVVADGRGKSSDYGVISEDATDGAGRRSANGSNGA
ncbi:MAG TPA: hypothetical protein VG166_03325 [Caulobacteraceae bacterium]|nr:hypothetical protein [Caulobacteraceae bacterium]